MPTNVFQRDNTAKKISNSLTQNLAAVLDSTSKLESDVQRLLQAKKLVTNVVSDFPACCPPLETEASSISIKNFHNTDFMEQEESESTPKDVDNVNFQENEKNNHAKQNEAIAEFGSQIDEELVETSPMDMDYVEMPANALQMDEYGDKNVKQLFL